MGDESRSVPTLFDWMGGMDVLNRLTRTFYARVPADPLLAPVFRDMPADHPEHVAQFIAEVFGGPASYSRDVAHAQSGHARMVSHHVGRQLTQEQRTRWIAALLECADEVGVPDDPEFRSAFVAYLEWGTRLAVINSNTPDLVPPSSPMPKWGWGVPGGPYQPAMHVDSTVGDGSSQQTVETSSSP